MRKKLLKLGGIAGTLLTAVAALVLALGTIGLLVNLVKGVGVNLGPLAKLSLPTLQVSASVDPTTFGVTSVTVAA